MGVATIVQFPNNGIAPNNGTSFAAPNMAGVAACLWQGFREYNNYQIMTALRLAGHRASNPNDTVGYGVPDAKLALMGLTTIFSTASANLSNCKTIINGTSKDMKSMRYEIERNVPGTSGFAKVGEIAGTGNIFSNRNYSFSDSLLNINPGPITYRIKQIFDTAASTYSFNYIDTVSVSLNSACLVTSVNPQPVAGTRIELLPNPAREKITVRLQTPYPISDLNFIFTNNTGQMVNYVKRSKSSGLSLFEFRLDNLASGKYYLTISSGKRILETKEFIKQ